MRNQKLLGERAIVIGGSIAGLLSARILSDFFSQVTVIERYLFPSQTPIYQLWRCWIEV